MPISPPTYVARYSRAGHCLRKWRALAVLVSLGFACLSAAGATTFTVAFDRDIITLGESANLSLTFQGGEPSGAPVLPDIPNLNISSPPGYFTKSTSINGVKFTSAMFTYTVTPVQPGNFVIPALSIQVGGQKLVSPPVKLTVLRPDQSKPESKATFLKLVAPKTEVYLGEILPVEIQIYFQIAQASEPPRLEEQGFTLGKFAQGQQTLVEANNQRYNLVPIKTWVAPAKTGDLNLGPATMTMQVPRPDSGRDIFGRIMDWQSVTFQSEPLALHVIPLPKENMPVGFNGAVGNYSLSVTASPTNVAIGDPITVTIQITGRGVVDSIALPEQTNWQQFKLYPPTSDYQPSDDLGLSGSKTFKLTAVPESMDIKELPPFTFSFFDPEQKAYHSLAEPAVPLVVRPSAASLPPPSLSTANASGDNPPANQDIFDIKQRPGSLAQIQPPLITRPWFISLQSLPVLAWLSLLVARRQKDKLAANPRLRRQRRVEQLIGKGLKELRQAANANDAEIFFATLFHLLQERLGERLDLPASAITEAVVYERLRPMQVPEATLEQVRQLFQVCDQARYARQSSNEELASLIPAAESVLEELNHITT